MKRPVQALGFPRMIVAQHRPAGSGKPACRFGLPGFRREQQRARKQTVQLGDGGVGAYFFSTHAGGSAMRKCAFAAGLILLGDQRGTQTTSMSTSPIPGIALARSCTPILM
jgi:hypothetical protein